MPNTDCSEHSPRIACKMNRLRCFDGKDANILLMKCEKCGVASVVPEECWPLIVPTSKERLLKRAEELGLELSPKFL